MSQTFGADRRDDPGFIAIGSENTCGGTAMYRVNKCRVFNSDNGS